MTDTFNKGALKAKIQEFKVKRAAALEAHDSRQLKIARRKIRRVKRKIRAHTV